RAAKRVRHPQHPIMPENPDRCSSRRPSFQAGQILSDITDVHRDEPYQDRGKKPDERLLHLSFSTGRCFLPQSPTDPESGPPPCPPPLRPSSGGCKRTGTLASPSRLPPARLRHFAHE